ncbi:MAG: hypothetical protein UY96_C0003G0086 [Parcubacteria group bacterium GW2011_GWB1_56_8]|nr:MAG: hypothetical protein UY96_C0003G0086 [Parcubacteria group bacterium GW2011_GWB1_56_8]
MPTRHVSIAYLPHRADQPIQLRLLRKVELLLTSLIVSATGNAVDDPRKLAFYRRSIPTSFRNPNRTQVVRSNPASRAFCSKAAFLVGKINTAIGLSNAEQLPLAAVSPPAMSVAPSIIAQIEKWLNDHDGEYSADQIAQAIGAKNRETVRQLLSRLAGKGKVLKGVRPGVWRGPAHYK